MAKGYNLSFDYVLNEMSYPNLIMYSAVLPSYDDIEDEDDNFDDSTDANNPDNFKDVEEEIIVRK